MSRRPDDDARYEYLRESGPNPTEVDYDDGVVRVTIRANAGLPDGFIPGSARLLVPGTDSYSALGEFMSLYGAPLKPGYDRVLYADMLQAVAHQEPTALFDAKGWILDDRLTAWLFSYEDLDGKSGEDYIERAIDAARGVA